MGRLHGIIMFALATGYIFVQVIECDAMPAERVSRRKLHAWIARELVEKNLLYTLHFFRQHMAKRIQKGVSAYRDYFSFIFAKCISFIKRLWFYSAFKLDIFQLKKLTRLMTPFRIRSMPVITYSHWKWHTAQAACAHFLIFVWDLLCHVDK